MRRGRRPNGYRPSRSECCRKANTQFLQNAGYIRLKNPVTGYPLPAALAQRAEMDGFNRNNKPVQNPLH